MSKNYLYSNHKMVTDYNNNIFNKKLNYKMFKNGIILPIEGKNGGVLDSNNNFVESSFHDGEWFKYGGYYEFKEKDLDYQNYDVIYLGVFIKQWGHFLLDSLSRAWILKKLSGYNCVYISNASEISSNYLRALELLGISKEKIKIVTKPTRFRTVIVPEMCTNSQREFTKEYPQIFDTMIKNATFSQNKNYDKVYLSRSKLKDAAHKEVGEKGLENNFRINGYQIIHPEFLKLDEQIEIFQKANIIACLNGSIPFNMLFGSPKLHLVILNKTYLHHYNLLELMSASKVNNFSFIDAYYLPIKSIPQSLGKGPFFLFTSKQLASFFKDNGMDFIYHSRKFTEYLKYFFDTTKIISKDIILTLLLKIKSF